jgi:hypothetical protein
MKNAILGVCVLSFAGVFPALCAPRRERTVPPIARLAGVTVGVTTIERLESRFGPGLAYTGGHPQGAREWRIKRTHNYVDADGFDYHDDGGRVVDSMSISMSNGTVDVVSNKIPVTRVTLSRPALAGVIFLGMTEDEILRAIRGKLPAPAGRKTDTWKWEMKGRAYVNTVNHETFTDWTAEVHFDHHHVDWIRVESD